MKVIRVDLAAGLWIIVERARDPPAGVHRQRHEVGQWSECVPQGGEEVLVRTAGDGRIGRGGCDEEIDRTLDNLLFRLRCWPFRRLRRFEVELAAVYLAAQGKARGP